MKHWARTVVESLHSAANWLRMPFAIVALFLILNLPTNLADLRIESFAKLPVELLLVIPLMILVQGRYFQFVRLAVTGSLALILLVKLADIATYAAFSRQFNPLFDVKLPFDGWIILAGTLGEIEASLVIFTIVLCFMLIAGLVYWSLGAWRIVGARRRLIAGSIFTAGIIVSVVVLFRPDNGFFEARASTLLADRVVLIERSLRDKHIFEALLGNDPIGDIPTGQRVNALKGKDVVVVFIESYGESAIRGPRYSGRIDKRLSSVEKEISAAGLVSKSSWLLSPTSGGLSWLAHGTLLSGVWVDSQQRYDKLMGSKRPSLNSLFREAGWRSVAVMPAITMDWPESSYFGYDKVYAANNLGYRGQPFNWVTMPDQYTLSAFQKFERTGPHKPVMAEIALISSHAPWTPIPHLIDWSAVGDGTVFNEQAIAGDTPEVVWQDQERVRDQYLLSIDYTLETLGSYMAKYGSNTVFILLGDHQPAPIITGEAASRAVPVHIVSDDPTILEKLDAEKWNSGMMPGNQPAVPMDGFREDFVRRFSRNN